MEEKKTDCASIKEHSIRRKDRALALTESYELLTRGEYGILATVDGGGQPYAVPLSYVVEHQRLYFHCAQEGHKIDNISQNPRASFAVVGRTQAVYENSFSTYYESAVAFGRLRPVVEEKEKHDVLLALAEKYLPEHMGKAEAEISKMFSRTAVYCLEIQTLTGKAKKEKK